MRAERVGWRECNPISGIIPNIRDLYTKTSRNAIKLDRGQLSRGNVEKGKF